MGREFNSFTPEHEAKWCMISGGRGQYDFGKVDELVDFAEANDMVIHGHALIWHSCSPDWVENARPGAATKRSRFCATISPPL